MWILISWLAIAIISAIIFGAIARGPGKNESRERKNTEVELNSGIPELLK